MLSTGIHGLPNCFFIISVIEVCLESRPGVNLVAWVCVCMGRSAVAKKPPYFRPSVSFITWRFRGCTCSGSVAPAAAARGDVQHSLDVVPRPTRTSVTVATSHGACRHIRCSIGSRQNKVTCLPSAQVDQSPNLQTFIGLGENCPSVLSVCLRCS